MTLIALRIVVLFTVYCLLFTYEPITLDVLHITLYDHNYLPLPKTTTLKVFKAIAKSKNRE